MDINPLSRARIGTLTFLISLLCGGAVLVAAERPRKIYAHYMGCFPAGSGPIAYHRSQMPKTRHDSTDSHAAMGGRFRNWPLLPEGMELDARASADLEIRRALRIGIDGFALDAWAGHQAKDVLDALFKVAESKDYPFQVTICLDPNCHAAYTRGKDAKGLLVGYTDTIRYLLERYGDSPKLARRDGRPLIFGYHSRGLGRGTRANDALGDPASWDGLIELYKRLQEDVGQPLYLHFGIGAFFYGVDLRNLPGARYPHQPGPWMVRAAGRMAEYFPAVGAFIDRDIYEDLDAMAAAVKTQGAEWSQPLWHQYQNLSGFIMLENGTLKLRDRWQKARATESTLIQYVTWNDYGEATNLAPDTNTRYTIYDLNSHFIEWWKTGREPEPDRDRLYLVYKQYPGDADTFPFRAQRQVDGVLEVLTLLPRPATVRLPGRSAEFAAPAGLHVEQLPLTPGIVAAELVRDGRTVLRLQAPEPITDRPFRESNAMCCFSTEFERHWAQDFGEAPPFYAAEYGDADGDGLPNWFEMYWFGRFMDWSTATGADPDADPDADGRTNLQEYTAQTDPTQAPPVYKVGDTWDLRAVHERRITFNPDPDFNGSPAWHYLYKIGKPPSAHDGDYPRCPRVIQKTPYTGPMVHMSPYSAEGFTQVHSWICREQIDAQSATANGESAKPDAGWRLVFRPRSECMMILAWESPVKGVVRFEAQVVPVEGADAISLSIEHAASQRQLFSRTYQPGKDGAVSVENISVTLGDRIFLVADALDDGDTSQLKLERLVVTLTELATE